MENNVIHLSHGIKKQKANCTSNILAGEKAFCSCYFQKGSSVVSFQKK